MYLLHISCALVFISAPSEIFLLLMLPIHMVVLLTCSKLLTRHSANKVIKKKSTSFHSVLLQPYNRSNVPPRQEARDILFFFFFLPLEKNERYISVTSLQIGIYMCQWKSIFFVTLWKQKGMWAKKGASFSLSWFARCELSVYLVVSMGFIQF